MRVIDFQPNSWFLLTDNETHFLDVYCNHSFVGFSTLIELNEAETNDFLQNGKPAIDELANDVQYYALTKYAGRNVKGEPAKQIHEAIMEFNRSTDLK